MSKEFIRDDKKVRKCDANIAKMNIFEFVYYSIFHWGYFQLMFSYIFECLKETLTYGLGLISNLLYLLFTPITLILCACIQIKNTKKRLLKDK